MKITNIGTDPEFFILKNGKPVCAIPYMGGASKTTPFPITHNEVIMDGFSFMHDRASVEFNVPPTMDLGKFKHNLSFAQQSIMEMINSKYGNGEITISKDASIHFDWNELMDPKAMEIGCSPSWNAWTNQENEIPDVSNSNLQCCGMHFHIEADFSGTGDEYQLMLAAVRSMDLHMALPSIILDTDLYRRELYGKAGEFRNHLDQSRFEYRVLSNFLLFNETYLDFMWNQLFKSIDYVNEYDTITGELGEQIQQAINTSDAGLAHKILQEQGIEIPQITVNV